MLGGEDYPTQETVIENNAELARSGGLERVSISRGLPCFESWIGWMAASETERQ